MCKVIAIANQDISASGINKKATIVQVLIAITRKVQSQETIADVDGCMKDTVIILESDLGREEIPQFIISFRTEMHNISETLEFIESF